jgi:hypothetical protein
MDYDPKRLAMALQYVENQQRQQNPILRLNGGGGMDQGVLSGNGRATLDIPINDRLTISPYFGGSGAIGSVKTPEGQFKIKDLKPEFGVGFRQTFD